MTTYERMRKKLKRFHEIQNRNQVHVSDDDDDGGENDEYGDMDGGEGE